MSSFSPPLYNSDIFNSGLFITNTEALTIDIADLRYVRIGSSAVLSNLSVTGNIDASSLTINGQSLNLDIITGITAGIATSNKALVVDNSRNISNINNLTATNLTGTLQTASQPNITSIGTLNNLNVSNDIITSNGDIVLSQNRQIIFARDTITKDVNSFIGTDIGDTASLLIRSGRGDGNIIMQTNNNISKCFVLNNQDINNRDVIAVYPSNRVGINQLATTISSLYNLDVSGSINCTSLFLNTIQINASANELNYLSGITPGTITANKAIVTDTNNNINSVLRLFKNTSGQQIRFENGTSVGTIFHSLNSSLFFGTISANDLILQAGNSGRVTISANGNVSIANTPSGLQLDLGNTGSGLNVPNLTFRGITFQDTLYTGITQGGAAASKAVVLNSTLDYSGIRDLSITRNFIASNSVASPTITSDNITANVGITGASINITGNYNSNGVTFLNNSRNLININSLDFSVNPSNKGILRSSSSVSGYDSVELFSTELRPNPNLLFSNLNEISPVFMELSATTMNRNSVTNFGQPFRIMYNSGNIGTFFSGLHITCMNPTQANSQRYNVILSARNGTIPHVVVNDERNQLHLFPQDVAETNTTFVQNVIVGEEMLVRKTLCVGTSQDTASSRLISALDGNMPTGQARFITLGRSSDTRNQAEISFFYDGNGSTNNRLEFGFFGGANMWLLASGRLGIGTNSPRTTLEVSGNNNVTTIPIGTNTFSYNISNNTYTNHGGGPFVYSVCAFFNGNIHVQNSIFATSDRRLKDNIKPIELDLEHYKKINPVTYSYKNEKKMQCGFIAQEMKEVCGEAVIYSENENLKKESEDDEEGVQLNINYNQIIALNTAAIKKLISKIQELEAKIEKIQNYGPIKKHLNRNSE